MSADPTEAALATKAAAFRWSFPLRMSDHRFGCEPREDSASTAPFLCSACRAGPSQDNFGDVMPKNGVGGNLGRTWRRRLLDASLSDPGEAPDPQVLCSHTGADVARQTECKVPRMSRHA